MLKTFLDKIFKQSGAYNDLESMLLSTKEHDKFSNLLPYGAYNDEEKYYLSRDERLCFIFEVLPLAYASKSTYDAMQTILDTVPFGTIIQSILYADDDISEYTESYMKIREGNSEEYDDKLDQLRGALTKNEKEIAEQVASLSLSEGTVAKGYVIKEIEEQEAHQHYS